MLISEKHSLAFVHIPKCAGTSVERTIQAFDPACRRIIAQMPSSYISHKGKHCFATDIREYVGFENWNALRTFAIVRNPFDRMISWYLMIKQRPDIQYRRDILKQCPTFEIFIQKFRGFSGRAKVVSIPQKRYICDDEGLQIVTDVLRFEKLPSCVNDLLVEQGINASVSHENDSIYNDTSVFYDNLSRSIVREHFKCDFDHLGYSEN